jgi:hypothetical protein
LNPEIEQLKKDILSDNWDLILLASNRLSKIGGEKVVTFLISLLSSENPLTRNGVALALKNIQDNRALEPLLAAIFKKENHAYNGTMVYALESLDCSKKLKEIFQILFYETFESKMSAYSILSNQEFKFTEQDLFEIQQMWDDCKLYPEKCPCYNEEETRAMMEESLNDYLEYLTQ